MKTTRAFLLAISLLTVSDLTAKTVSEPADPGWPREHFANGNRMIVYQPQVDAWTNFQDLSWRMAVAITPKGGKETIGVIVMKGKTLVDNDNKIVVVNGPEITSTNFPGLDAATSQQMTQIVQSFVPPSLTVSLHRVIASMPKEGPPPKSADLKNDPPKIFVAYRPSVLVSVDGEPVLSDVPKTNLKFVVNSQWPIFFSERDGGYFLPVGQQWMTAKSMNGPWAATKKIPAEMSKVAKDKEWSALAKVVPPPANSGGPTPEVFYSDKPAEVVLFDGQPTYTQIPQTQLSYANNTDSVVFVYTPTQQFYYLTAGRWFSASDLQGPWTYSTPDLPADFQKIPTSCPASAILASVPGTEEAKDAVLLAEVPTTVTVDSAKAASQVQVQYGGDPKFEPIQGTSMSYATNTRDKVIKVGDVYYLCLQGVWFIAPNATGPWTTANAVPKEIYTIPASSPVYNVTYVTQTSNPDGTVQSSYTAGYLGAFVLGAATGAIIASGTGYWGAPYCSTSYTYKNVYNYPSYYPYPTAYGAYGTAHYNSATGAYGYSQTASGPYGTATRGAAYNPYTGTAARGATVSTPYGSRSAAQAYNPYTGTYAQTKQGSSPTAQWGSSYVSNGNKSATAGHYSTANGTVAGASGSQGGKAMASNTAWGSSAAAQTKNGNMYASHDGNVYKNTGSGWESASNSNSANKSSSSPNWSGSENSQQKAASQSAQQRSSSAQSSQAKSSAESSARSGGGSANSEMDREAQNRSRGNQESQRFSQERGGGGGGGRGGGGGGRRR